MIFSERVNSICKQRNNAKKNMESVKEGSSEAYYLAGYMSALDTALVTLGVVPLYQDGYVMSYEIYGERLDVTS